MPPCHAVWYFVFIWLHFKGPQNSIETPVNSWMGVAFLVSSGQVSQHEGSKEPPAASSTLTWPTKLSLTGWSGHKASTARPSLKTLIERFKQNSDRSVQPLLQYFDGGSCLNLLPSECACRSTLSHLQTCIIKISWVEITECDYGFSSVIGILDGTNSNITLYAGFWAGSGYLSHSNAVYHGTAGWWWKNSMWPVSREQEADNSWPNGITCLLVP